MATAFRQLADNAVSTTATVMQVTGITSITSFSGDGNKFPMPGNGFIITIWSGATNTDPGNDPNMEELVCSARIGDVLTTSPTTKIHAYPVNVGLLNVAKNLQDAYTAINVLENKPTPIPDKNYIQSFTTTTSVSVPHNLNKYPTIAVFDSANSECEGQVQYIDINNLTLTFSAAFSGTVTCN